MTPALIERLKELHAASTPGEWVTRRRGFGYPDYAGGPIRFLLDVDADTGVPICGGTIARESDANMQLIAALHNAFPQIMAELSRLRQSEAELRRDAEKYRYMRDNAPKEGVTVQFRPGGDSIIWGVVPEADAIDAARYRWLRSSDSAVADVCNKALPKADGFVFMEGDELDAAIDAALGETKK